MKKKGILAGLMLLTALLLSGCAMRTIDEMYSLPKRSAQYDQLQSVIDIAMAGLEYSAPLSGENQQAVQTADLNGDGADEYLVFAKGTYDKPMQILIFTQNEDKIEIMEVIASNGTSFDMVEYAEIDGKPGLELVVGRQVSDQLMKSAAVYSFASGRAERLMNAGYTKLLTCDLGSSSQKEILLIQRGETDTEKAIAVLYRYRSKSMIRSMEVVLSRPASDVKLVTEGKLQCATPAVYVSSTTADNAIRTDILMLKDDRFVKLDVSDVLDPDVQTLRNYYVYAEDVDEDGIIELPRLVSVRSISTTWNQEDQYLIRWYSVDRDGTRTNKRNTFHNYSGGWYLNLEDPWANQITFHQVGNNYAFYMWDDGFVEAVPVFTIYALSGSDRQTQATEDGRFSLYQGDGVIYAAKLESDLSIYGIDEAYLINSFHVIHQEWNTGTT